MYLLRSQSEPPCNNNAASIAAPKANTMPSRSMVVAMIRKKTANVNVPKTTPRSNLPAAAAPEKWCVKLPNIVA